VAPSSPRFLSSGNVMQTDTTMTDPYIQNKALETITLMNTAIINLRLYPTTSATISRTIDRLVQALSEILVEGTPLIIAESERMLLFGNEPAWPNNQEKAHVRAFIDILIKHGIKSITFMNGLENDELITLFTMLSQKPDKLRPKDGIQGILMSMAIRHIRIDEKIYMAKNVNSQLDDSMDSRDGIIKFLMQSGELDSLQFKQIREAAKEHTWIAGVFDAWMKQLKEKQDRVPKDQLSKDLLRMASMLLKIVDPEDSDWICRLVSRSITEMDSEMVSLILARDVEGLCGRGLFEEIVLGLDMHQFNEAFDRLNIIASGPDDLLRTSAASSLERLKHTDKGRNLDLDRKAIAIKTRDEREQRLNAIKERTEGILKGERTALLNYELMSELPEIFRVLYLQDDGETANAIIEALSDNLQCHIPDLRNHVAEIISLILVDSIVGGRNEQINQLSEKLADWLRTEIVFSTSSEKICRQLQEVVRTLLVRDPFLEVNPILDIFSLTQSVRPPGDRSMIDLARVALRELATEDLLTVLINEFQTNENGKQKEAAQNLGRLGVAPLDRLLFILQRSEDSAERVRILQTISQIGMPSIPAIHVLLSEKGPWYFLRNLAYLLGRVGGEEQANEFIPLLLHNNQKVQTEALNSLQRVGGKVRAETLLSVLPRVNDQFKLQIVEMLGIIKASEAIPAFLALLQSRKSTMIKSLKADLDVVICNALGSIGSREALSVLTEVSQSKGFFNNIGCSYPEKVRNAASKAIVTFLRYPSNITERWGGVVK
jgi:HEAT repeat protein